MAALVCCLLGAVVTLPVSAASGSLYSGDGPRPGPAILYAPLAVAQQLTNAPGTAWQAAPILVSGTSAYRQGEYLYQDFLYDDHGAAGGARDPGDPRSSGDLFSGPNGTYTYPTAPGYAGDAADLVELRMKPQASETVFRVTLNTMIDPSLAAFTVALASPTTTNTNATYPHGTNTHGPADVFVSVHNTYAELAHFPGGASTALPGVIVDIARRQIEVHVPHSAWNPGTATWRVSIGVGLWDKSSPAGAGFNYLRPAFQADAVNAGGCGTPVVCPASQSAFFNVGFRHGEPGGQGNTDPNGGNKRWWRDENQGVNLEKGDISTFHDDVNFGKLAAGVTDDMNGKPQGVPLTGPMDRILASHFETEQGTDYSVKCANNDVCKGELRGRLQPYAIYIPTKKPPASGYGLTLLLHSLSANYNQYLDSRNQSQFGERATGSIVITPSGRGPDGWYTDYAQADTFEVWADVAARYNLDAAYTAIAGYSMGGYGTFRLGTLYPDLFYKGQPTVGPPGDGIWVPPADTVPHASNTFYQLASLRNVPMMMWAMHADELVPFAGTEWQAHNGFDALGLRYQFWVFAPGEHLTLAINDQFQPAADWLGAGHVDRNPPHVTYVANPKMAFPAIGVEADHAYWLSGIKLADGTGASPLGTIDVRSEGFGVGDPTPSGTKLAAGHLDGGVIPIIGYEEQSQDWSRVPKTPVADKLDISGTNVSSVTINVQRAHVDCNVAVSIKSDVPMAVNLQGCTRTVSFASRLRLLSSTVEAPAPLLPLGLLAASSGAWALRRRVKRSSQPR
jgi:hypothetical protein